MKCKFHIRCDASPAIGTGHFMRTFCLARELRKQHTVCFLMAQTTPLVETMLREEAMPLLRLKCGMTDEPAELATTRCAGKRHIIVDHYGATPDYLWALREWAHVVGVIDDLGDRDLTAADWVLNQNLGAERLRYRTRPGCGLFLGTRYCLLRPQFAERRATLQRGFAGDDIRVLITLGGGVMLPFIVKILAALEEVPRRLAIRAIVASDPDTAALGSTRHTLEILHNVTNMAEHMAWADLSINAGGSTTWELCTLGVPMIVVPLSDDQVLNAALLDESGCAIRMLPEAIADRLGPLVAGCLADPERRARISPKGQELVDGLGAQRAAMAIEEFSCSM